MDKAAEAGEVLKPSRAPGASGYRYAATQTAKLSEWWAPPGTRSTSSCRAPVIRRRRRTTASCSRPTSGTV